MKRTGEALSVMILCLSAVLAWRLGFSLGASDVEKHLLALISVALEGWKVLLPFVMLAAWRQGRWLALTLSLLIWPLLTAYSFVGGLGFSELNRASLAGTRGAQVTRAAALKAEIADLTSRLIAIATTRSPAEIEAALTARTQTPVRVGAETKSLLAATDQCRAIVSKRTVNLCAEVAALRQELAQAHDRLRLETRRETQRTELATLSGLDWAGVADPQIAVVSELTGLDATRTRQLINIGFATLLELIGGLGLFFASLLVAAPTDSPRPVAAADDTDTLALAETEDARLARYLAARTVTDPAESIIASKLHADYSIWAHAEGAAPVSLTAFGNLIAKQGIRKEKVDGLMRYQNLSFQSNPAMSEAA